MAKFKWQTGPVVTVFGAASGQRADLVTTGLLRMECQDCASKVESPTNDDTAGVFFMLGDLARYCPTCGGKNIKKTWTRPMTVMVPEEDAPAFMAATPAES